MDNTTVHPFSKDLEHVIDLFLFKGRPVNRDVERQVVVLINHGYAIGFSPDRLQPLWAAYRVAGTKQDVDYDRPHLYYEDTRLDPEYRIGAEPFGKHEGIQYHVGHMVPNEVINRQFGRLAQMETFFMSNMSPQRGSLNMGVWRTLENMIHNIEDTPGKDHVWAIAGPIFSDDPIQIQRPNNTLVPIPDAYYYITIDPFRYPWDRPSNVDIACFRIPQDAPGGTTIENYLVDLEQIETETRLSFFPAWLEGEDVLGRPFMGVLGIPEIPSESQYARHRLLKQLGAR
jgi:DNA/RNA endonuclease G (NUC1)